MSAIGLGSKAPGFTAYYLLLTTIRQRGARSSHFLSDAGARLPGNFHAPSMQLPGNFLVTFNARTFHFLSDAGARVPGNFKVSSRKLPSNFPLPFKRGAR